jgi:hypothetical protein
VETYSLASGPEGDLMDKTAEKLMAKEIVVAMIENKLFVSPPGSQHLTGEALNALFVAEINKAYSLILENIAKK